MPKAKALDYDKMWKIVMEKEAKDCMEIVAESLDIKLTAEEKKQVIEEYVYQTTACVVYDYIKMKAVLEHVKKGKKRRCRSFWTCRRIKES